MIRLFDNFRYNQNKTCLIFFVVIFKDKLFSEKVSSLLKIFSYDLEKTKAKISTEKKRGKSKRELSTSTVTSFSHCTLAKKKSASCVNKKTARFETFFQLLNVLNGNFCIDIVICYLFFIIEIV